QFPDRDIVPVVIDTVASGGGGIHCATHDQPGEPID
ncbi:agmatine deiminase family protein, partial [Streptomyces anulatus]